jgi:hypothetical protein
MTTSSPSGASLAAVSAQRCGTIGSKAPRTIRAGTATRGSLASIGPWSEWRNVAATRLTPASRTSRARMGAWRRFSRRRSRSHRPSCRAAVRAPGVGGGTAQHQGPDTLGMAHRQIDRHLAAERIAQHGDPVQGHGVQPADEMVGVLGQVKVPPRVGAESKARQIRQIHRMACGQTARGGHHVAVRHRQAVHEHHRGRLGRAVR